jgi:hypothetical protein
LLQWPETIIISEPWLKRLSYSYDHIPDDNSNFRARRDCFEFKVTSSEVFLLLRSPFIYGFKNIFVLELINEYVLIEIPFMTVSICLL